MGILIGGAIKIGGHIIVGGPRPAPSIVSITEEDNITQIVTEVNSGSQPIIEEIT